MKPKAICQCPLISGSSRTCKTFQAFNLKASIYAGVEVSQAITAPVAREATWVRREKEASEATGVRREKEDLEGIEEKMVQKVVKDPWARRELRGRRAIEARRVQEVAEVLGQLAQMAEQVRLV